MQNPYISDEKSTTNKLENSINKAAKELPFIPENFNTAGFIKGVLIGGALTYILTNQKAQNAIFKAIIKAGNLLEASTQELKERYEDAKAEFSSNQ